MVSNFFFSHSFSLIFTLAHSFSMPILLDFLGRVGEVCWFLYPPSQITEVSPNNPAPILPSIHCLFSQVLGGKAQTRPILCYKTSTQKLYGTKIRLSVFLIIWSLPGREGPLSIPSTLKSEHTETKRGGCSCFFCSLSLHLFHCCPCFPI